MRSVLWIIHFFPRPHKPTDGIWAIETLRSLKDAGIQPIVLSPTPWIPNGFALTPELKGWAQNPAYANIDGIPVFYPKCPHYPHRIIRQKVYLNFPYLEGGFLWHWCRQTVQHILKKYQIDIVHANFLNPAGWLSSMIKEKFGIPFVLHERSVEGVTWTRNHPLLEKAYKKIAGHADAIIVNNSTSFGAIRQLIQKENLFTLRAYANLKNTAGFIQEKPKKYFNKRIILSVGSFTKKRKGQAFLLKAINEIKNNDKLCCIFIGSGTFLKEAKILAKDLKIDHLVEFWGQCTHETVLNTMSWCDVFVLPSWNEGFGTVYSEAMSFGKPIIGCRGEGISEVVEDHKQGILVKPQNVEDLSIALSKILTDEKLSKKMGTAAKTLAETELNYQHLAKQLIQIYQNSSSG